MEYCGWFEGWEETSSPRPSRFGVGNDTLRVQAGYCAVPDFAESTVDAVELLLRATTALRDLKRGGDGERFGGSISHLFPTPRDLTCHSCRTKPTK